MALALDVDTRQQLVSGGDPEKPAAVPDDSEFGEDGDYIESEDLKRLGEALILAYPDELGHLATADIRYLWRRVGGKTCGKAVLGFNQKLGKKAGFLAHADFVIELAADHARDALLTAWHLEALLFHELLHGDVDPETGKPAVRAHDAEMFLDEVRLYGLWRPALREARIAFEQVPLPIGFART